MLALINSDCVHRTTALQAFRQSSVISSAGACAWLRVRTPHPLCIAACNPQAPGFLHRLLDHTTITLSACPIGGASSSRQPDAGDRAAVAELHNQRDAM